jgi:aminopeptidase N
MFVRNQPLGARTWFPCVDTLTDRCTFSMEITVDSGSLVIASGELEEHVCPSITHK